MQKDSGVVQRRQGILGYLCLMPGGSSNVIGRGRVLPALDIPEDADIGSCQLVAMANRDLPARICARL